MTEKGLSVIWAGWCRRGDWDAARVGCQGNAVGLEERSMDSCTVSCFTFRNLRSKGLNACHLKEEVKVAVAEPLEYWNESKYLLR